MQWGTPANVNFRTNHVTELDRFNFAASWSRSDAAVTQLAQTGVANARGSINTYDVNAGVTHDLGRIDTISWTVDWNTVSFTDPTQIPYNDVNSTILWAHTFSPTTTFTNSVNFDWFSQDNAANSQRLLWRFTSGVQSQLTPRLTFNGQIGLIFANAYQNGNAQSTSVTPIFEPGVTPVFVPGVTPFQPLIGAGHGWIGNVGLSYRLLKDTSVSFNAAQAITPMFTGQLQQSSSLATSLNRQINQLSNLSFFASYAQTTSPNAIWPSSNLARQLRQNPIFSRRESFIATSWRASGRQISPIHFVRTSQWRSRVRYYLVCQKALPCWAIRHRSTQQKTKEHYNAHNSSRPRDMSFRVFNDSAGEYLQLDRTNGMIGSQSI